MSPDSNNQQIPEGRQKRENTIQSALQSAAVPSTWPQKTNTRPKSPPESEVFITIQSFGQSLSVSGQSY